MDVIALLWFTFVICDQVLAGSEHTCALFRHVTSSQEELLSDHSGEVRGRMVQSILKEAATLPQANLTLLNLLQFATVNCIHIIAACLQATGLAGLLL